jgi:hypothetical protein
MPISLQKLQPIGTPFEEEMIEHCASVLRKEMHKDVVRAAEERLVANSTPCPKCGANWGLIARCAAPDCPSPEARLEAFRNALAKRHS